MVLSASPSSLSCPAIDVRNLSKVYPDGLTALNQINLQIQQGEIFALLGPNGAGKTTLISIICGLVNVGQGQVLVGGRDVVSEYRAARKQIGLVPQELTLNIFDNVWNTLVFSRGVFGKPRDDAHLESVLKSLSLWDKRHTKIQSLSGGMKRRVLIAKALAHEPDILFLDEPTAGVDVELRRDMWRLVASLRARGVTIILTTHYIEEAEAIADRIGIINHGEILLVEDKQALMNKLGRKQLILHLRNPMTSLPKSLEKFVLQRGEDSQTLIYDYDDNQASHHVTDVLSAVHASGLEVDDVQTRQRSLEEIFVGLVEGEA
ncbi:ABC-type multidrug transport system, ATPase component [Methylophaga frappieri]|uniref:ABC-type multidrug transport system, ATPase component n=1 Tax=Methylophaga frappieri (strain ATCC BAA-2434 / DSM 25690 / JAM7) TaxID=754477 RepID=I1YHW0_METFJ|nr:ABC transporter ATP-binding protein [Methylophaga frappieri]AFJ02503.1 ABC-type multidrug transport system, ATPase component [Methylophaga frappieri]